jgi:hypothetical protein
MSRMLLSCWVLAATAALAAAQPRPEPPRPLHLSPNKPPVPVLRFTLLPELRDQEPGDAWPLYKKAGGLIARLPPDGSDRAGIFDTIDRWEKLSYADLPRDEARKVVAIYREPLALLEKASRCENCNSEIPERIRKAGVSTLLTEVQQMRSAVTLLCLMARLELAEDQPVKALRTLRVAYSIGQRVGESSTLISLLIGVAVTTVTNNTLLEALNHPRMPNLYWTLTNRRRPFISLDRALEGERLAAYANIPRMLEVARNLDAGPIPEEKLEHTFKHLLMLVGAPDNYAVKLFTAEKIRSQDAEARKALIDMGRPPEQVEKWPPLQVALAYGLLEYDQLLDEIKKWDDFPYYQARPKLEEVDRKFRMIRARPLEMRALPVAVFLFPAVTRVVLAPARLERQFASLRCVEAIRLHAAGHGGKLPASLADIKEVPLPVCPATGKPFDYRLEGDTALLSTPDAPELTRISVEPLVYQITIRR